MEVIYHSDPTRHTAPGTVDTPGVARAQADCSQHQEATAPENGLTSLEDEPAYRYGYDVGQRFPEQDWGREKPRSGRAGNGGIRAPGSVLKTPSGRAGRRSVAPSTPMDHREEASGPSRRMRRGGALKQGLVLHE